jgi:hypothetical protein
MRIPIADAVYLLVISTLVTPVCAQNQTQTQEWSTHDDPILGISIQYPKGWEAEESPDALTLRITNGSGVPIASSIIWKGMLPGYMETSEEVMKSKMNEVRGEVEKINNINGSVVMDGKTASKVDYSRRSDSNIFRLNEYFIADKPNDTIYAVGFMTKEDNFAEYLPIFEKMVSSFKIQ